MKNYIFLLLLLSFFFANNAVAKFDPPKEGYRTVSDKMADGYFRQYNDSKDDKMTFEQFQNRSITRQDKRAMRKDQKAGTYISDKQKFEEMDEDKDGFVSREEMKKYISKTRKSGGDFY